MGSLARDLRRFAPFADLGEEDLEWIADRCTVEELAPGQVLLHPGDPADTMLLLLEGELHSIPEPTARDAGRLYILRAGEITGMLPYSRMKRIPRLSTAATPLRVAKFPAAEFQALLERIPRLEPRMVALLADRIRQTTTTEQQLEKLTSLGRLAAGLAHELNNPAAAASRSAAALRTALAEAEASTARLTAEVGLETRERLTQVRMELVGRPPRRLSTLDRADAEERLAVALESVGVEDPWQLAPSFVDAGVDDSWLDEFLSLVPVSSRITALECLESHLRAGDLLRTVEDAADRVARLVGAVKQYTFMDRAPLQEIDVHEGLDSTLRILAPKLAGIELKRDYSPDLPRITAYGAELNQVWTNILDNAADALDHSGRIGIRTWTNGEFVFVEVQDSGPGIPEGVIARVFDPFFSTKGVGAGTGLGLDIARRIVEQHRGAIHVESAPGATCFRVDLPIGNART